MKRVFTTLFLFLSCAALNAQNPLEQLVLPSCTPELDSVDAKRFRSRKDSIRKHRPVVALVLAGGGAKGMAHIGVLKYMEERGLGTRKLYGPRFKTELKIGHTSAINAEFAYKPAYMLPSAGLALASTFVSGYSATDGTGGSFPSQGLRLSANGRYVFGGNDATGCAMGTASLTGAHSCLSEWTSS